MEKYKVELLPAAYSDLDEIFDYIMVDSIKAANEMLESIMKSLHRLENFPHSGTPLVDHSMKNFNFKMIIIDPYIAFYRIIVDKVIIYRILHCARKYPHLLKESI
jgi:toxin ParE1/3/4